MAVQTRTDRSVTALHSCPWQGDATGGRASDRLTHRLVHAWIDALTKRGLRAEITRQAGDTVLHLRGRLDGHSAPVLKGGFQEIIPLRSGTILVDMEGVDRVDGMGLAALVWAWRLARECGGTLRLTRLRPPVREIVAKMSLHYLLEVAEDRLLVPQA